MGLTGIRMGIYEMGGDIHRMEEGRSAFKILTGKFIEDRLVGLVVSMSDY